VSIFFFKAVATYDNGVRLPIYGDDIVAARRRVIPLKHGGGATDDAAPTIVDLDIGRGGERARRGFHIYPAMNMVVGGGRSSTNGRAPSLDRGPCIWNLAT
jgi:hypothetical protein